VPVWQWQEVQEVLREIDFLFHEIPRAQEGIELGIKRRLFSPVQGNEPIGVDSVFILPILLDILQDPQNIIHLKNL
jgi:hypothetical protein